MSIYKKKLSIKNTFLIISFILKILLICFSKNEIVFYITLLSLSTIFISRSPFFILSIFYLDLLFLQRLHVLHHDLDITRDLSNSSITNFTFLYILSIYISIILSVIIVNILNLKVSKIKIFLDEKDKVQFLLKILRIGTLFFIIIGLTDGFNVGHTLENKYVAYGFRIYSSTLFPFFILLIISAFQFKCKIDIFIILFFVYSSLVSGSRGGLAFILLSLFSYFIFVDLKINKFHLFLSFILTIIAILLFPVGNAIRLGINPFYLIEQIHELDMYSELLNVISYRLSSVDELNALIKFGYNDLSWSFINEIESFINLIVPGEIFNLNEYENIVFQFTELYSGHVQKNISSFHQDNWSFAGLLFFYFDFYAVIISLFVFALTFIILKLFTNKSAFGLIIFNTIFLEYLRTGYLFSILTSLFYLVVAFIAFELFFLSANRIKFKFNDN